MLNNGGAGTAPDGERPFDDRTGSSLMVLGKGLALLNGRLGVAEGVASATADANVHAFRTVEERLDAQDRRISELQAALIALAKTLGVSPVWSNEISDAAASGGVKH